MESVTGDENATLVGKMWRLVDTGYTVPPVPAALLASCPPHSAPSSHISSLSHLTTDRPAVLSMAAETDGL